MIKSLALTLGQSVILDGSDLSEPGIVISKLFVAAKRRKCCHNYRPVQIFRHTVKPQDLLKVG